jgi:hypothetical protein
MARATLFDFREFGRAHSDATDQRRLGGQGGWCPAHSGERNHYCPLAGIPFLVIQQTACEYQVHKIAILSLT